MFTINNNNMVATVILRMINRLILSLEVVRYYLEQIVRWMD